MSVREITTIVWHQGAKTLDVIYGTGDPDHLKGSREFAAGLAADAGLQLGQGTGGTVLWTKSPDDWFSS